MSDSAECPVCQNAEEGSSCRQLPTLPNEDLSTFQCDVCGRYKTPGLVGLSGLGGLKPIQRALLSYRLRTRSSEEEPFVTSEWVNDLLSNVSLPTPAMQATNLVRFIGDEVSRSGKPLGQLPIGFHAIIGSFNRAMALRLIGELQERKILTMDNVVGIPGKPLNITLTLDGWERYEAEKRGRFEGDYGFIAMQFDDSELDPFVKDIVKPAVKEGIRYDLFDMRDVGRAGVVDNIMRTQIRGAAFIIVDLTHDNSGAYWEAGYAEGLGKPVLYICEKTKFEEARTHFDTNHCTTVLWSRDDDAGFKQELIATLRRSLNL